VSDEQTAPNEETADEAVEERALPASPVLAGLIEPFEDALWGLAAGQDVVTLPKSRLGEFGTAARQAGFEMCADVTAVDYLGKRPVRFEVVANLLSVAHGERVRVRCPVPADDPTVPSLVPVYPGANFFEREVFDMFGIVFEGHPDMTRILMPDDWEGHPLRKDYGVGAVPVQFKAANQVI